MSTNSKPQSPTAGKPDFRVRLQVLFASQAHTAVVLRRGPKHHFQLIHWDTKSDTFTPGQWMKGIINLCDLSPNGKYLIYRAQQYHRSKFNHEEDRPFDPIIDMFESTVKNLQQKNKQIPRYMRGGKKSPPIRANEGTWTAICKPPWFSALAIWPTYGTWTGGGYFKSDKEMVLFESEDGMTPQENTPFPAFMKVLRYNQWREIFGRVKPSATSATKTTVTEHFSHALSGIGVEYFEWAIKDKSDHVLFACDGAIYRLKNWQDLPVQSYLQNAAMLADFNADRFTQIAPTKDALNWR